VTHVKEVLISEPCCVREARSRPSPPLVVKGLLVNDEKFL
jgi:hypothetical protein